MIYYTTEIEYKPIGAKKIPSHCPDCNNSNCLELTFYQKHKKNTFYLHTTKKISATLYCHHTGSKILAVLWNEQIEKHFYAEKKKLKLEPSHFKLRVVFYLVIAIIVGCIISFYAFLNHQDRSQKNLLDSLQKPEKGLKLKVMLSLIENNKIDKIVFTWFNVNDLNGDTIILQQNKDFSEDKNFNFSLEDGNFNGKIYKVSREQFNSQGLEGFDYKNRTFSGFIMETKK